MLVELATLEHEKVVFENLAKIGAYFDIRSQISDAVKNVKTQLFQKRSKLKFEKRYRLLDSNLVLQNHIRSTRRALEKKLPAF